MSVLNYRGEISSLQYDEDVSVLDVSVDENGLEIFADGDIDIATHARFEQAIMGAICGLSNEARGPMFTIDLTSVDFIDSSGLSVLLLAGNSLKRIHRNYAIILDRDSQPARIIERSGIGDLLSISLLK